MRKLLRGSLNLNHIKLDIDDGSNIESDFRDEIKRILEQYFK